MKMILMILSQNLTYSMAAENQFRQGFGPTYILQIQNNEIKNSWSMSKSASFQARYCNMKYKTYHDQIACLGNEIFKIYLRVQDYAFPRGSMVKKMAVRI